ncbi:hypothetical protein [Streptomyces sp. NPDC020571]|uniref:hypothetical protein n=1 Tax=Streptomyces sp. NPDC020571 TaxID=3365079 RepID=UPI0037AF1703
MHRHRHRHRHRNASHSPLSAIFRSCSMVSAGASRVASLFWSPVLKALITTRKPSGPGRSVSTLHITTPEPAFSPGPCRVTRRVPSGRISPPAYNCPALSAIPCWTLIWTRLRPRPSSTTT